MRLDEPTVEAKRAWTWGYLSALRVVRELRAGGLSWREAVTEAGKRLMSLVQSEALPFIGGTNDEKGDEAAA
jgi:hypothetical protein